MQIQITIIKLIVWHRDEHCTALGILTKNIRCFLEETWLPNNFGCFFSRPSIDRKLECSSPCFGTTCEEQGKNPGIHLQTGMLTVQVFNNVLPSEWTSDYLGNVLDFHSTKWCPSQYESIGDTRLILLVPGVGEQGDQYRELHWWTWCDLYFVQVSHTKHKTLVSDEYQSKFDILAKIPGTSIGCRRLELSCHCRTEIQMNGWICKRRRRSTTLQKSF